MSDASAPMVAPPRARSRPYLKLLWLIPGLAMLGAGLYYQMNVPEGGEVNAIKLTTKQGMVGQAAEVVENSSPGSRDLYLKVYTTSGEVALPAFKDMPIGNGLIWNLPKTYELHALQRIDVWDHNTMWKDTVLDHMNLSGWGVDGQKYHVDLLGTRIEPPKWSWPVAAAGAALTLVALLRFVWDQVI